MEITRPSSFISGKPDIGFSPPALHLQCDAVEERNNFLTTANGGLNQAVRFGPYTTLPEEKMTPLDDYAGVKPEFASVANITEQAGTAAYHRGSSAQRHISMHTYVEI